MITIRHLRAADIPRLIEIRPGFVANTVLRVTKTGTAPFETWLLQEEALETPFDKGSGYDFDANERKNIRTRLAQDNTLIEIAIDDQTGKLVGILDIEEEAWRRTVWVWNIMLDHDVRGQGLGRQFMERTIAWGRQRGLRAIMLETQTNNPAACHFYAHMGFQLVGINEMFYTNHDIMKNEVGLFWAYPL